MYQKAYIEFFCSPDKLERIVAALPEHPSLTFMAINLAGEFKANFDHDAVNAVTWGVFPAHEVEQPTVVDPHSFKIWKVRLGKQYDSSLSCDMHGYTLR